jgi:hypothetical protein
MTRKLTRNPDALRGIAPLVAVLTLTIALAALAQTRSAGQASAGPHSRSATGNTRTGLGAMPLDPGAPLFLPAVAYDAGEFAGNIAPVVVADVNGDGKPDLLVPTTGGASVLLGNGDGTFQAAVTYSSGGVNPFSLAVADVNGDGKLDLAVANFSSNNVGILLGNGDGTFQPAVTFSSNTPGGSCPASVAFGNLDGDGKPDLIVANYCAQNFLSQTVGVFLNNGDGTFQAATSYTSGGKVTESVIVADVNHDGKSDLIVVNFWASDQDLSHSTVSVLLGNGDGSFQDAVPYDSGGAWALSVAVADVNGDGKPDLAVANSNQGTVGVLLGNGDGTFQPAVSYSLGGLGAGWVAIADVNGDNKPDLAVASCGADSCSSGVGVMLGNGDGSFQAAVSYGSGGIGAASVTVADVNHDTRPDLAVATCTNGSCSAGAVGILLHVGAVPTTTTVVSSLNPSAFGQQVTFTAAVSSASGTPKGTVMFFDGSTALGSAQLSNGKAPISTSAVVAGSRSIVAIYQGSLKFNSSTSSPLTQVVNIATTTTTLDSSLNPAPVKHAVSYTAGFTGQYGGPLTGTLTFQDQGVTVAIVSLDGNSNHAGYGSSYAMAGIHALTAIYSGDANNTGSSASLTEYIQGSSMTVVTTSGSPSFVGQPVTFTATVSSKSGVIPNGDLVTFYDGTTLLGSNTLTGGTTTFTDSSLSAKTHSITANYTGDPIFTPSIGKVKQVVQKYPSTTTLISAPNPSQFGQAVTFTAQVTSTGPAPTGKVKFLDGTTGIGSGTLSGSGVAKLTKSTLAVGTHPITAQYVGDAVSDKSTSSVVNQVVQ